MKRINLSLLIVLLVMGGFYFPAQAQFRINMGSDSPLRKLQLAEMNNM